MPRTPEEEQYLLKVGKAIRRNRKSLGVTQETFARKVALPRSYYAAVERGEHNISVLNLEKIAGGLNLTMADLLEQAEKQP